ncbi:uncharacterized protein AC631_03083 [Debaryomyces fabryi]|uniref:Uncharacterized protein n=1 Tax=Debaryomyces fabryi TaxID=58627 RepID=A0A0V1PY84_9ASCO|nr:uncharacterized protein AC631_03083 [Debaryomyces fabryi]KSA01142.1 hypothetical protein AC631_03083 [Debaryomyces fabryi]CUM46372.1 unnamed protein product [Debaryomyces fabryi]
MSSDSMSVHSLIDKFSNTENVSNERAGVGTRRRGSELHQKSQKQQRQADTIKEETEQVNANTIDETGLLTLLGPNVKTFPFSEEAYIESVKLRAEQEKTKQSYYKLETANKNLLMLNTALKANIPAHLIPLMYVPNEDAGAKSNIDSGLTPGSKLESSSIIASPFQQGNRTGMKNIYKPDASNSSLVPPINYKFGGSNTPNTTRRPLSPAKIGAAAVANLATPTNPYRNTRRNILPQHQRHFSMPASTSLVTPNRHRATPSDLNAIDTTIQNPNKLKAPSNATLNAPGSTSDSSILRSPLGATSSIQVKPSPAQPLHKLTKLANQPSQESMTSFQHIIQFHHWKPDGPNVGASSGGSPIRTHKRHKSSSENMSIDLTANSFSNSNNNPPEIRVHNSNDIDINSNDDQEVDDDEDDDDENDNDIDDDDDNDITMETSTITDINVSKIPRTGSFSDSNNDTQLNIGRYPHDILSPSNS